MGVSRQRNPPTRIFVWDVSTGKDLSAIPRRVRERYLGVALSANGRQALVGLLPSTAILFDVATGNERKRFALAAEVTSVALSPDGRYAAVGLGKAQADGAQNGEAYRACIWETTSGAEVYRSSSLGQAIHTVCFTPDSKRLLFAHTQQYGVCQIENKSETLGTWKNRGARSVSFFGDGRHALIDQNGQFEVFDLQTKQSSGPAFGPPIKLGFSQICRASVTSDGKRAVLGCTLVSNGPGKVNGSLRLLDLETRQELGRMEMPGRMVVAVAISPDGTRALAATGNPEMKTYLFDLTRIKPPAGPPDDPVVQPGHAGEVLPELRVLEHPKGSPAAVQVLDLSRVLPKP